MLVRNGSQKPGRAGLLRRLLGVGDTPAISIGPVDTHPLFDPAQSEEIAVSDATLQAISYLTGNDGQWDIRVLFGSDRVMTVAACDVEPPLCLDLHNVLGGSLPVLLRGDALLAVADDAEQINAQLEIRQDLPLTYLQPMLSNNKLCGLIVIASEEPFQKETLDGLRAVATQSAQLLDALQVTEGLRRSEAGFRALVQNASDIIMVVHPDLRILDLAPTAGGMLGYRTDDLLGTSYVTLVHPEDRDQAVASIERIVRTSGTSAPLRWRLRRHDGTWMHVETVLNNLLHDPGINGIVLSARDVSERKALEENILHQVFHDELTGLPNRAAFMNTLESALERHQSRTTSLAVLFIDLDRFKVVNDSLGHEAGNALLIEIANRLRESVRPGDTVARLSGDEFVVMVDDIHSEEPATDVAQRILYRLQEAIRIDSSEVFITSSIGIALASTTAEQPSATDVLRSADLAMYEMKNRGRRGYMVFSPHMHARAIDRLALETELRYAVSNSELQVFYQPLIQLETGRVDEVEALVRWMHPTRGLLLPDTFISIAEETGLIEPIGQWVLEEVCRQGVHWGQERPHAPPLHLNVNLSVRQFQQATLVRDIQRTLTSTGIDPHQLTLEITESVALEDAESAVATMHELKKLGIRLAIDDFGTGYSALSYLKQFPVDALKIDRSFIEGLHYNHGDIAIVKAVIAFAKTMNLQVTAEGVETPDQLRQLRSLGCDLGQGYFFATPLPGVDLALDSHYGTRRLSLVDPVKEPAIRSIHRTA